MKKSVLIQELSHIQALIIMGNNSDALKSIKNLRMNLENN